MVPSQLRQIVLKTLSQNYPTQTKAGGMIQVVECLPINCEVLSSNTSTTKKNKIENKEL
jgi:hypothetical protein